MQQPLPPREQAAWSEQHLLDPPPGLRQRLLAATCRCCSDGLDPWSNTYEMNQLGGHTTIHIASTACFCHSDAATAAGVASATSSSELYSPDRGNLFLGPLQVLRVVLLFPAPGDRRVNGVYVSWQRLLPLAMVGGRMGDQEDGCCHVEDDTYVLHFDAG